MIESVFFPLVLIFDILLLHFGNICCALPTAHPESNMLRHESSQVLEVGIGMVTLWNSLKNKSRFLSTKILMDVTNFEFYDPNKSHQHQKKTQNKSPTKNQCFCQPWTPPPKKKCKNTRKNGPHLDRGILFWWRYEWKYFSRNQLCWRWRIKEKASWAERCTANGRCISMVSWTRWMETLAA